MLAPVFLCSVTIRPRSCDITVIFRMIHWGHDRRYIEENYII